MKHRAALTFLLACSLPLGGCPYFFGYDDHGNYEPVEPSIGALDHPSDGLLGVDESAISIVVQPDRTFAYIPVKASGAVEGAEVRAWLEPFESASRTGEAARRLDLPEGQTRVRLELPAIPDENVPQVRLGYSVEGGETGGSVRGLVSVVERLARLRISVSAPDTVAAGDAATVRVMASFAGRSLTAFDATVDFVLEDYRAGASASASTLGIASVSLDVPASLCGEGEILIAVQADGLSRSTSVPVTVIRQGALLLSPDKPRYQPGQTIELRLMALQRPLTTPLAGEEILLEIRDGKGYKVFKETLVTNAFGIASTSFALASEVNTGTYELRAVMGEEEVTERVIVEPYVLPKFSVSLDLDRGYVLRGEPVEGGVALRYTFGEPVAGATVSLVLAYGDDTPAAMLTGSADENGRYDFSMDVGAIEQAESLKLTVEATDPAGQKASAEAALPMASQGIALWLVPAHDRVEGGPWQVFLIARDPSGSPIRAAGRASWDGGGVELETSALGIAQVELPPDFASPMMHVWLQSEDGLAGSADFDVRQDDFPAGITLRAERAKVAAGEDASILVEAPEGLEAVQIDATQGGGVVLSDTVELGGDGQAAWSLPVTAGMDGVIVIEAFGLDGDGELLRGRTALYVFSPGRLTVTPTLDKETYRPGETARLELSVKDRGGSGVHAGLGLVIVDEAVYALQSFTPTTVTDFFAQQSIPGGAELVMGKEEAQSLLESEETPTDELDDASRALLASCAFAQGAAEPEMGDIDTQMELYWATRKVNADLVAIAGYFSNLSYYKNMSQPQIQSEADDMEGRAADPWGRAYRITTGSLGYYSIEVTLRSSGPDETAETEDDIEVSMTAGI
jgi:hypothetical protein